MLANLTPYITPSELLNGPTGIDWLSIPQRGASSGSQAAEQTQICWRVTDRIDELAEQILRATVDTETQRGPDFWLTVDNSTGEGKFLTARWPILQVLSGQWCYSAQYPPQWTAIAQNQFQVDDIQGYLGSAGPGGSGAGANRIMIAPGNVDWSAGRNGFRVQVMYINGWPNCGITASGAKPTGPIIGDTTIHVDDICGWGSQPTTGIAGKIYDGASTEGIVVSSTTPDTVGANSGPGLLNLSGPLLFAHALATRISSMPATLQQAGLNLATAYARMRGATAIAAQSGKSSMTSKSNEELMIEAEEIISKYARIL